MDQDLALALKLQEEFDREHGDVYVQSSSGQSSSKGGSLSLADESWELMDPNPDIRALFLQYNERFFWGRLAGIEVKWSPRMTLCAGLCVYEGRGGLCSVRLSLPLLKLRPRRDLVQTLLHEMIHAYLFVTDNNKDHDGHGPEFHKHMYRINQEGGVNITVYHTFHDEVAEYRQHWWRCNGPCQSRKPYFGYVKRAMNRPPGPRDPWFRDHQNSCNGTFIKVKEPENYGKKKKKDDGKVGKAMDKSEKKSPSKDIRTFFGKGHVLSSRSPKKNSSSETPISSSESPKHSNVAEKTAANVKNPPKFYDTDSDDELFIDDPQKKLMKQRNSSSDISFDKRDLPEAILRDLLSDSDDELLCGVLESQENSSTPSTSKACDNVGNVNYISMDCVMVDKGPVTHKPPPSGCQSSPLLGHSSPTKQNRSSLKYGELIILGYNGHLPSGDKGRKKSKFILGKRASGNGVKPYRKHVVKNAQAAKALQDPHSHSVTYTLSRNQAVVVEYKQDDDTDMFQIGRSSEVPIDFVVMDTIPGHLRSMNDGITQSTISRFACRILVDRNPPYTARIYAAGFDSGRNIFLGEKAVKWYVGEEIDGLTTNGVFIMKPQEGFYPPGKPGVWREVSVGGAIYPLRESRSAPLKTNQIKDEDNVLQDGTLIDLCGATLLWRSALGLISSPSEHEFEDLVETINAGRPQCPVGLNTLVLPKKGTLGLADRQPYVYLQCGHVHGQHQWGQKDDKTARTCPLCLKDGTFIKLKMGCELSFYADSDPPTHCFNPCGHMASEKTVRYWSELPVPHGCQGFHAICPFCATPLSPEAGFIKLIFQDNTD
ncbi:protein pellino-like [Saccostrea echinata]|uniref:protein pellino-like n=1 Tax=Saccostrea echinata TaxID=191078 RepID=UPI002A7EE611|nr:protein pellino-like [Saccostrea echinata]